jgi:hypothetical protein
MKTRVIQDDTEPEKARIPGMPAAAAQERPTTSPEGEQAVGDAQVADGPETEPNGEPS